MRPFQVHQKSQTHKMIFSSLRHGMSPALKGVGAGEVILLDTIPLIRHILCPHIRSVSEHLMSRAEKSDLEHTVTVMVDLGLSYNQIQLSEGKFKYQLEPDLEHISTFPSVAKETPNYWTCQLVSREVQEEYIRRATPKLGRKEDTSSSLSAAPGNVVVVVGGAESTHSLDADVELMPEPRPNILRTSKDLSNVKEVVRYNFSYYTFLRSVRFACELI